MARRLADEKPYSPLDDSVVQFVLQPPKEEPVKPEIRITRATSSNDQPTRMAKPRHEHRPARTPKPTKSEHRDRRPAQPDFEIDTSERMSSILRLKVSTRDKREFEAFVARLAAGLDTTLRPSNVLRVLLTIGLNAEAAIAENASRSGSLRRPPNDDTIAYAEFEQQLVRIIDSAIRSSTPIR